MGVAATLVVAMGCGDDGGGSTSPATGGAGGGSSGGAGGGAGESPSAKPTCASPGADSALPDVRADSSAALSGDGLTLVLFGGDTANVVCPNIPPKQHVGDTWVLDTACGQWTELSASGPSARSRHSMVADPARDRVLLFGGRWRADPTGGNYTLYNDVWSFDFATQSWTHIPATGTAPSPRYNTTAVVDGDRLIVFGGGTATSAVSFDPVGDVFALDLTTSEWSEIQTQGAGPSPRLFHSAAYDPAGRRIFTGYGSDNSAFTTTQFFKDLWVLDLETATWTQLEASQPPEIPYGRIKSGMSFRPSADGVEPHKLFAAMGHDDAAGSAALGNRNDVLAMDIPAGVASGELGALTFSVVREGDVFNAPANGTCDFPSDFVMYDLESPERRSAFSFAPTAGGDAFVIFAGDSDCDRLNDAWWFDTRTSVWEPVRESLPGLTCPRTNGGDIAACPGMCG
jgi:N-acetylneuraminic acid mutarotase